jgi:ABC-2 type transport system permease protein
MNDVLPAQAAPAAQARRYWPLLELVKARLLEFIREPEAVFWVYGFPILMALALGFAFREKPQEQFSVDLIDSPQAAPLAEALRSKPERFRVTLVSDAAGKKRLGQNESAVLLAVAPSGQVTYVYDDLRSESLLAHQAVDDFLQRHARRQDAFATAVEVYHPPGSRYIDFLIPGLLGMGLMGGGMWGVGFVTVDMRIRKLLKRFLATPMRRRDFLMALMTSRFIFMVPEIVILLTFAYFMFGVAVHGSIVALVALIVVGAFCFAGLGLLVASRAKTIETVSGLMNLIMLPMWVLSGIFFSAKRFPDVVQPVIQALPLTVLNNALRSVMNEGMGLAEVSWSLLTLAAWGLVCFLVALRIFRWE